ncbi:hypothetical protein LR48_Vigan10g151600 [Vigna angularis]|uniref:Uncharacterized protein n=1 Tax=Phaseolus angularis TaxID=3914 RepID=A0A0L9VLL3_PHAAN|nr:hypothetical protein LR48_Vigan10g151600 [Vigna angularis]
MRLKFLRMEGPSRLMVNEEYLYLDQSIILEVHLRLSDLIKNAPKIPLSGRQVSSEGNLEIRKWKTGGCGRVDVRSWHRRSTFGVKSFQLNRSVCEAELFGLLSVDGRRTYRGEPYTLPGSVRSP